MDQEESRYQLIPFNTKENVIEQLALQVKSFDDVKPLLRTNDRANIEAILNHINNSIDEALNEYKYAEQIKADPNNSPTVFLVGSVVNNPLKGKLREYNDVDILVAPTSFESIANSVVNYVSSTFYKASEEFSKNIEIKQNIWNKAGPNKAGERAIIKLKQQSLEAKIKLLDYGLDVIVDKIREKIGTEYMGGVVEASYGLTPCNEGQSNIDISIMTDVAYFKAISDKE